jgi:hypothetical protein
MSDGELKRIIEQELKHFTSVHFEKPADCKNAGQIRFYTSELNSRIEAMEARFNYVPAWAYALLAQYNAVLTKIATIGPGNSYY